ncbi:phosphatidylinositol-specific phospholipase C domain-containing protein [Roseibacillus persicicus]|uniref:phosphatidylinositol-specific phospholipase C domain-containing protein n=1 Tax=Roseibacillus persicicus TaxID=454148 RepID=UPI00398AF9CC
MTTLFVSLALALSAVAAEPDLNVPISDCQVIGTHNSYHIAPKQAERDFIKVSGEKKVRGLEYSHPPLPQQFDAGIRQIELDCFADPKGGAFADPMALKLAKLAGKNVTPLEDPDNLLAEPGTKVLHFPDFDFRTTVLTLTQALAAVRDWSAANPSHFPILVLLELKGSSSNWQSEALFALEKEILTVLPTEHLLTPDRVRGEHPNLRTAIREDGWPTLQQARGKIILALDNTNEVLSSYLEPDPLVKGRLLFPSCPSADHPSSAWFKLNDPFKDFDTIQKLSKQGYLIRTRADSGTIQARNNDTSRREKAFASGAQFISTDYPVANPDFSNYAVELPNGAKEFYRFRKD